MEDIEKKKDREQKRKNKLAEMQRVDDMRTLLAMPEFRRFVWGLLGLCHIFKTSMTGNSNTFFAEGERNIGLRIIDEISLGDALALPKLMTENHNATTKENTNA